MSTMQNYYDLIKKTITEGNIRTDRTNTGTISLFGPQLEFNLADGFPLDPSRKIFMRGNLEELFWMLRGSTDNNELKERNVHIWDLWEVRQQDLDNNPNSANAKLGALGPVYGEQWVNWPDPANDVEVELTFDERIRIAEDYLAAGVAQKFTQAALDDVKEDYAALDAIVNTEPYTSLSAVHRRLTNWGIPRTRSKKATINQIAKLIEDLKTRPNSRRHIISAWNVPYLPDESLSPQQNVLRGKMALAPCHTLFQYYVEERTMLEMLEGFTLEQRFEFFDNFIAKEIAPNYPDVTKMKTDSPEYWELQFDFERKKKVTDWFKAKGVKTQKLSCKLYQRSGDGVIGVAFNIAAYAAQTMMVAQCVDMAPGRYIHTFGDFHIYKDHLLPNAEGESVFTQLAREVRPMPKLWINPEVKDIFAFKYEDFKLEAYDPHAAIRYKVAV